MPTYTYDRGKGKSQERYHYTRPSGDVTYPLTWDHSGEHYYETGVQDCVLYLYDNTGTVGSATHNYYGGVAWNGITSCTTSPEGADTNDIYADNNKYLSMRGVESFGGSIGAYTYPDEWEECDGSGNTGSGLTVHGQTRKVFGLAYMTKIGNDSDFADHGWKLHLIYGATASPSSREYTTVNDSPEALEMSWDFETTPVEVGTIAGTAYGKTAYVTVNSLDATDAGWDALMKALRGTTTVDAYLPTPSEVYTLLQTTS